MGRIIAGKVKNGSNGFLSATRDKLGAGIGAFGNVYLGSQILFFRHSAGSPREFDQNGPGVSVVTSHYDRLFFHISSDMMPL
jgi:hypothetical protein